MAEDKKSQGKLLALTNIEYGEGSGEVRTIKAGDDVSGLPKGVVEQLKADGVVAGERAFARARPELLEEDEEEEEPIRFTAEAAVRLDEQEQSIEEHDQSVEKGRIEGLRKMAKDSK